MAYKDKDKQREAQRDWVRQKRAKGQGSTAITDACSKEHKVDYEGRRRDYELLKGWAEGEGTVYQKGLGETARQYSIINGFLDTDKKLTSAGRGYLGAGQAIP